MTAAGFRHRFAIWSWNGLQAFVNGLVSVAATVLGTESVNAVSPGLVMHFSPHQMLTVSIVGGLVGVINYVRTNKLPPLDTEPGTTPLP